MTYWITQFAEESADSDLFGMLGIDWTALLLQTIAFIILVVILAKFIYPPIAAMLDRHDQKIENAMQAAKEAQENASKSEAETAALLEKSRNEAANIVEAAKKEAADIVSKAESDATARADAMLANAREELEQDVEKARVALRGELVGLVATATESIIDAKIDQQDEKIIAKTLGVAK